MSLHLPPTTRRQLLGLAALARLTPQAPAWAATEAAPRTDATPAPTDPWPELRQSLFGDRPVAEGAAGIIELQAPARAQDAAVVPLAVRALLPQTEARWIRKVYLVIDGNPSPMGAVFTFSPRSGRADIETRVRMEQYSMVRAIAELDDGRLLMDQRYVKASGGCSAAVGEDAAAALARLGRLRMTVDSDSARGEPAHAQLMISHPNLSGLAIDQLTRLAPQPRFVRQIDLTLDGEPLLSATVDFTLSENPNLRFRLRAGKGGALKAVVTDTESARFETVMQLLPMPEA